MNHQNALIEHSRVHTGEKHSVVWIIWNIMSELNPVKNLIRVNTAEKDWRTCVILNVILKFTALEKHAKELVKNKKILSFVSIAQQVSKTIIVEKTFRRIVLQQINLQKVFQYHFLLLWQCETSIFRNIFNVIS